MVLRTEDLVKKYRTRTVVNHVSINVKQGEIVGLLGPNGAGKTTTFYMTVGLVTPNEGKIFLNDMEITKFPVYKRARNGIGYLAQEASIFRKMTVEDNIRSVLEMTGRSVEYQKEKLESLISEFGLNKVRKNLGDQLSGGERRRAEIARCLAKLVDAPFIKVEATKFTEVGYVGRDVDSMVRDLVETSLRMVKDRMGKDVELTADQNAQERILDALLDQGKEKKKPQNPIEALLGLSLIHISEPTRH